MFGSVKNAINNASKKFYKPILNFNEGKKVIAEFYKPEKLSKNEVFIEYPHGSAINYKAVFHDSEISNYLLSKPINIPKPILVTNSNDYLFFIKASLAEFNHVTTTVSKPYIPEVCYPVIPVIDLLETSASTRLFNSEVKDAFLESQLLYNQSHFAFNDLKPLSSIHEITDSDSPKASMGTL